MDKNETRAIEVYDPHSSLQDSYGATPEPLRQPSGNELFPFGEWARSLQTVMQQQLDLLHQFDQRLTHLEETDRQAPKTRSFEERTWWALWAVTMLLLGAALTVVILLVLSQVF